jgi:hypothetical protein
MLSFHSTTEVHPVQKHGIFKCYWFMPGVCGVAHAVCEDDVQGLQKCSLGYITSCRPAWVALVRLCS